MSTRTTSGRVTAKRIAQEASVSQTTVSFVLNGRGDTAGISPATQQRVLDVAAKLNYVPDYFGRGLRGVSNRAIGVLWFLAAPQSAAMVRNFCQRFARHGYEMQLTPYLIDPTITVKALEDFEQRKMHGVVVHASEALDLKDRRTVNLLKGFGASILVPERPIDPPAEGIDVIVHDLLGAVRQVAEHMQSRGRRRPAILTPATHNRRKAETFAQALDRPMEQVLIDIAPGASATDYSHLVDDLHKRYGKTFPFDAVFCTTDELAIAVMAYLRMIGRRVPDDVAVVGFDDVGVARWQAPPLASVKRNDDEVAALVEQMLFCRLEQPDRPAQRARVAMEFVWRESAG